MAFEFLWKLPQWSNQAATTRGCVCYKQSKAYIYATYVCLPATSRPRIQSFRRASGVPSLCLKSSGGSAHVYATGHNGPRCRSAHRFGGAVCHSLKPVCVSLKNDSAKPKQSNRKTAGAQFLAVQQQESQRVSRHALLVVLAHQLGGLVKKTLVALFFSH